MHPPAAVRASASPPAAALRDRALALRHRHPQDAVRLAERARSESATDADARRATAVHGAALGLVAGEVHRARTVLQEALHACEDAEDEDLRAFVLNELAASFIATHEFEPAATFARRAADSARARRDDAEHARALRLLGTVSSSTGDFVHALGILLEALEIHERIAAARDGDADDEQAWERGTLFGRIAIVYSNLDQFERALSYYEVALQAFGDRFPLRTARTLYRMGIAADGLEDRDRTEDYYRRSHDLYAAQGNAPGRALGMMGMADVMMSRGDHAGAEPLMRQVVHDLDGDLVHQAYFGDALRILGETLLGQGRWDEALAQLERALPLYLRTERPPQHLAWLHERFCRAYRGMGAHDRALEHHERFHALTLKHIQAQADARMSRMMVRFDTERAMKDREISRLRSVELEREIAERKEAEAALAAAKAELEEKNRALHALTIRDPLTGLYNRRYLDERLAEAFALARRSQPLSVMICDVDDFKRINDGFSHAVGDEVLRIVASILRRHLRQSDVAARFGGEEFVVIFPGTTRAQAAAASEKLCRLVREWDWPAVAPGLAVTLSAGVAAAEGQANHEKLLSDADRALYQAKHRGKDRVVA